MIPDFPLVWDSTLRSSFVACPRQFFWAYLNHLRKPGLSIDLHFGGCFARGLEVTRKAYYGGSHENVSNALAAGYEAIIVTWGETEFPVIPRRYKSLASCLDALASYFEHWPLDTDDIQPCRFDDKIAVEMSFALPVDGTAHPVTGEPLIYAGRFDMLADWRETSTIWIEDDKTSNQLGQAWRNNWKMRGQLSGYCWGARSFGVNVAGAIIRGVGILSESITFDEVPEPRPNWMIERWLHTLRYDLNRAAAMWESMNERSDEPPRDAWPQALDSACSSYGGCQFLDLCDSEHPERWFDNYDRVKWDPLHRMVE